MERDRTTSPITALIYYMASSPANSSSPSWWNTLISSAQSLLLYPANSQGGKELLQLASWSPLRPPPAPPCPQVCSPPTKSRLQPPQFLYCY